MSAASPGMPDADFLELIRTHYTVGQRANYAAQIATRGPGEHGSNPSNDGFPKGEPNTGLTEPEAAKRFGVSALSVQRAKRVRRNAVPEVVAALEHGAITLNRAETISKAPTTQQAAILNDETTAFRKRLTAAFKAGQIGRYAHQAIRKAAPQLQAALLEKAIAATKEQKAQGKKQLSPGTLRVRTPGFRRKKISRVLPRVISVLEHHADLLSEYLDEHPATPKHGPKARWLSILEQTAKSCRRTMRWLEPMEEEET